MPFASTRQQTWWRDTRTGDERLLSQALPPQTNGVNQDTYGLALSDDGSYALFSTRASNLVDGAGEFNEPNLFHVSTRTGQIEWINQREPGTEPDLPFPSAQVRTSHDLSTAAFLDYNAQSIAGILDSQGSLDSFVYRSDEIPNNPGLGGLRTSASDPSQGFHFLAMPERGQWLASWYTYRTEQGLSTRTDQRWLIGLGTVSRQNIEFVMTAAKDGVFDAGTSTIPEPVGHLRIRLDSCIAAHADYALTLAGQSVSGSMTLDRISSDAVCKAFKQGGQPAIQALDKTDGSLRIGHTAAWHDAQNPGQGMLVEVLPDTQQVLASWYTFDPANPQANGKQPPLWLLGQGTLDRNNRLRMFESLSGRFAQPSATVLSPVGTIQLTPISCTTLLLKYDLDLNGTTRAGTQMLQRLTPGLPCSR